MNIQKAIDKVINRRDLSGDEMEVVMRAIMTGEATPAQIAGLLVALRMKGESVDEVAAATRVMRELATPVSVHAEHLVDIVGTGGDGARLFNVSTASSFVAAAAGCHVAKHGNRSVSSSSGAADLLEAAGVELALSPEQVARCVEEVGVGFMFAPQHHSAMKHAIGPRKELATRTIFNMLGPMTNPAGVKRQLLGVYDRALLKPVAEVLNSLGSEHVMVVHSEEGLDEISIAGATYVAELCDGKISEYTLLPADGGVEAAELSQLSVNDAKESLALVKKALAAGPKQGAAEAAANILALNAGAAIYVAGVARSFAEGTGMASDIIASGSALEKMNELAQFSRVLAAAG
ncbi:MAG: anthranilate phosphoribosyltransferase [Gammaproteobacteria bacterium]|nr:anthranilate phosphoribosyltransferase [Gammaproteobacteria bacterium]NNM12041.1 anthranilate phosphoribosyltransferase [Pseudomonadales bacterium]